MVINDPVKYPDHLSSNARDLIGKLLEKEPSRRLGGGDGDWTEIKVHPFFDGIDWDALLRKEIEPEWKPALAGELDTDNFDPEFTAEKQGVSYEPAAMIGDGSINLPGFTYAPDTNILKDNH
jgi:serine/threonine protein kinase